MSVFFKRSFANAVPAAALESIGLTGRCAFGIELQGLFGRDDDAAAPRAERCDEDGPDADTYTRSVVHRRATRRPARRQRKTVRAEPAPPERAGSQAPVGNAHPTIEHDPGTRSEPTS